MRRLSAPILVLALLCAGAAQAQAPFTRADSLKAVVPGQVYREYSITMASGNDWRVTDPSATNPGGPGNSPATYLPNPVLGIPVDDLQGAIRVVAIVDVWGGHVGTIGKRFRLNGNSWLSIPDIANTEFAPECYTQQYSVAVEVPLLHLLQGNNALEGTSGGQTCFNFDWGQWGWYGFLLRVYYDPVQKSPPTGAITVPVSGAVLQANPIFEATASSAVGISRVDFIGYHENHDADGDGVYLDWQQSHHRLAGDNSIVMRNHLGTASGTPYRTSWNTQWIPDQAQGGIKAVARIRDTTGLWLVTNQVTDLSLNRPDINVRLYKPTKVPRNYWVRAGRTDSTTFMIPATDGLILAQSARMVVPTWNGIDAASEPGQTHWTKVNGWTTPNFGVDHAFSYDNIDIPLGALRIGTNTISFFSESSHHGVEVLWPGPAVLVRYAGLATAPATVVVQPADVRTVEGLTATFSVVAIGAGAVAYQWQKNAVDIIGAGSSTYTTPILTAANSGDRYRCRVSNAVGSDTSLEATLTIPAIGPRNTDGQIILYKFDEGGGATVNDVSGVGAPANLVIANPGATTWRPGALAIDASTYLATTGPATELIGAVKATNEITIEAWLKPANLTQTGPARIMTLSSGTSGSNVTFGQGQYGGASDLYDVRLRTTTTTTSGTPSLATPAGTLLTRLTHVVFTRRAGGGTVITIDGIERANGAANGDLSNWDESFRLILANELAGDRPWLGEYHLLAVYDRALPLADILQNYAAGPSANGLPTAALTALPTSGTVPLTVDFDAAGSVGGGTAIVAYHWDFGDGASGTGMMASHQYTVSGSFTATLTVTNGDGGMASAETTIEVIGPPAIVAHPAALTVNAGQTATFSVVATGTPPLGYRWQKGGVDIPGASGSAYTTQPLPSAANGIAYRCLVSNPVGEVVSDEAILTVVPPAPRVAGALLALYTFREGAGASVNDVSGVGVPLNLTIHDTNAVSWRSNGLSVDAATLISSPGAATKITTAALANHAVTVEAWITPANTTQMGPARIVSIAENGSSRNFTLGQGLWDNLPSALVNVRLRTTTTDANGLPALSTVDGSLTALETHVVYTRDAAGAARIYINGAQSAAATVGGDFSNWNAAYRLGLANEIGADRPWLGAFHLVAVYGAALTPEQVMQNYGAGAWTEANVAPVARMTAAPTVGVAPLYVNFDAGASTDADGSIVSHVWDFGDGGTATGVKVGHQYPVGRFTATLTVTDNSGNSNAASMAIAASRPQRFTVHPEDQIVTAGQTATFRVVTPGPGRRYQWQVNKVDIAGANAASYTTRPAMAGDDGASYRCVVSDSVGRVSSGEAVLAVRKAGRRITDGLVALYAFGENGSVTVPDESEVAATMAAVQAAGALTLEAWLRCDDAQPHEGTRLQATGEDPVTPEPVHPARMIHVVHTRDEAGTARKFVDGVPAGQMSGSCDFIEWQPGGIFSLTGEPAAESARTRETHLAAAYDRALSPAEVSWNFRVGLLADGGAPGDSAEADLAIDVPVLPAEFSLKSNYPNPFNPQTSIVFDLPRETAATLRIYDVAGRLVEVLLDEAITGPGRHQVDWQGRNQAGLSVAAGVYFYRLDTPDNNAVGRMVLLK